jgi:hypothetical protein
MAPQRPRTETLAVNPVPVPPATCTQAHPQSMTRASVNGQIELNFACIHIRETAQNMPGKK